VCVIPSLHADFISLDDGESYVKVELQKHLVTLLPVAGKDTEEYEIAHESNNISALQALSNTMAFVEARAAELRLGGKVEEGFDFQVDTDLQLTLKDIKEIKAGVQQIIEFNTQKAVSVESVGTLSVVCSML
jgi:hypothetical protein